MSIELIKTDEGCRLAQEHADRAFRVRGVIRPAG